jgi:hypothetical protein
LGYSKNIIWTFHRLLVDTLFGSCILVNPEE